MTDQPCATCGGKGWVPDGSVSGVPCADCADPVVAKYMDPSTPTVERRGSRRRFAGVPRRGGMVDEAGTGRHTHGGAVNESGDWDAVDHTETHDE